MKDYQIQQLIQDLEKKQNDLIAEQDRLLKETNESLEKLFKDIDELKNNTAGEQTNEQWWKNW